MSAETIVRVPVYLDMPAMETSPPHHPNPTILSGKLREDSEEDIFMISLVITTTPFCPAMEI